MPHTANNPPSHNCVKYSQKQSIGSKKRRKKVKNRQNWSKTVENAKIVRHSV